MPEGNWQNCPDTDRFQYQYGNDLAAALAALDGKDIAPKFDWVWLIQRIQMFEARGHRVELVQTWSDGTTRMPATSKSGRRPPAQRFTATSWILTKPTSAASSSLLFRDDAVAEGRAERAHPGTTAARALRAHEPAR